MNKLLLFLWFPLLISCKSYKQEQPEELVHARVDFSDSLRPWDGFGVNYVQSAQWRGYNTARFEDYGGFHQFDENERREIFELVFGDNGLKPSLLKMFLDPYHEGLTKAQNDNDDPYRINMEGYDHETTTNWMRYFAREGLRMTRDPGRDLEIITTLYGPAPWMTKQKFIRGRDLNPNEKYEVAEYMISWVKYLINEEGLPVKYISLHNEGENNNLWDPEGLTAGDPGHDHNMWWPVDQIIDFLTFMPGMLQKHGIPDVKLAPGECMSWGSMIALDISQDIASHDQALKKLGRITSHSFYSRYPSAVEIIRDKRKISSPDNEYLHAWVTFTSFVRIYIDFLYNFHHEIYSMGVNGIIPCAPIQTKEMWVGSEPNAGCAIWVHEGEYIIRQGYYFLKSFMRVGMGGMNVVRAYSTDKDILITAFAPGQTNQPAAFNVLNVYENESKKVFI